MTIGNVAMKKHHRLSWEPTAAGLLPLMGLEKIHHLSWAPSGLLPLMGLGKTPTPMLGTNLPASTSSS